ncbi:MAG TPA: hypothetical protein VHG29_10000 [Novosphingobium sp.]|nr:hypothetical protein [Novosphingobium sp.]
MESSADMSPLEIRLWALETILAFVIASQHLQNSDPGAALERLHMLVLEGEWPLTEVPENAREAALDELARVAARVRAIQVELPRRLVD